MTPDQTLYNWDTPLPPDYSNQPSPEELAEALRAAIAERDALKHDIEQYVRRDTERLKQLAAAIAERDAERDRSSDLLLRRENVMEQLADAEATVIELQRIMRDAEPYLRAGAELIAAGAALAREDKP